MTAAEKEYAGALYALAAEENACEAVFASLCCAQTVLHDTPQYLRLVQNPALPMAERLALLQDAFAAQLHPYVLNFMKILCEKSALQLLDGCCEAFRAQHYVAQSMLPVTAISALPLSDAQQKALTDKLAAATNKTILLTNTVDAAVLGGIKLQYAGLEQDGTVSGRLAALKQILMA